MTPPFKTGDEVRLRNGGSKIIVLEVDYFFCNRSTTMPPRYKKSRYGKSPMAGWYIRFAYVSSISYHRNHGHENRGWREAEDFVLFNTSQVEKEAQEMPTLYQTKEDKPRFGTLLTKNSKGQLVLEMKGKEGEVEVFSSDSVDEVMPFTVELSIFQGGPSADRQKRHYELDESSVELGDILYQISNATMWEVTALNTKCRSPTNTKNGFFKLEGKRL